MENVQMLLANCFITILLNCWQLQEHILFFPLYRTYPSFQKLEIIAGIDSFATKFWKSPRGFWLPELGYHAGIDRYLRQNSIDYTIVNDTGVLLAQKYFRKQEIFFPLKTQTGFSFVFPAMRFLSMKIWSSHQDIQGILLTGVSSRCNVIELQELSPNYEHKLLGFKNLCDKRKQP